MAIELLVLSGTRLGERITFDQDAILIGSDRFCDLRFKLRHYPGARNQEVRLLGEDSGWRLHNDGEGLWLVNQTPVPSGGACPLRSGDIIRASEFGPDLRFMITAETGEKEEQL
jgi:hypothetical protein